MKKTTQRYLTIYHPTIYVDENGVIIDKDTLDSNIIKKTRTNKQKKRDNQGCLHVTTVIEIKILGKQLNLF